MGNVSGGLLKIVTFVFVALTVTLILLRFSPVVFPGMAQPSPSFDCDDAALAMYRHFQNMGIESVPIIGNLDLKGEEFEESNHVWLLVDSGGRQIAYDWGSPRFDSQHYEGYTVSLDFVLSAVAEDIKSEEPLIIAER